MLVPRLPLFHYRKVLGSREPIDLRIGARQQPPPFGVHAVGYRVFCQNRHGIYVRRNGVAQQLNPRIIRVGRLNQAHVLGHVHANALAGSKEKISHHNAVGHVVVRSHGAGLIRQFPGADGVVHALALQRIRHHGRVQIRGRQNRQLLLGAEQVVAPNHSHHKDHRQRGQSDALTRFSVHTWRGCCYI